MMAHTIIAQGKAIRRLPVRLKMRRPGIGAYGVNSSYEQHGVSQDSIDEGQPSVTQGIK
jgi:hypothetical protein